MFEAAELNPTEIPEGEIIAQKICAISRLTPPMMAANMANVATTLFALWATHVITLASLVWAGAVLAFSGYMLAKALLRRGRPFPRSLTARTQRRLIGFSFLLGCLWAYPGLAILPTAPPLTQAFLVALCAGMVVGRRDHALPRARRRARLWRGRSPWRTSPGSG